MGFGFTPVRVGELSHDRGDLTDIRVGIQNGHTRGTTGVTAAVLTLITGATEDMGYPGMGPALRFGRLWQDRVKRMLVDHAADPDLVPIRSL